MAPTPPVPEKDTSPNPGPITGTSDPEGPLLDTKFLEGEKVLCFHGPLIYEAKIQKVELRDDQTKYFIHYMGWNKNWDEWVSDISKFSSTICSIFQLTHHTKPLPP